MQAHDGGLASAVPCTGGPGPRTSAGAGSRPRSTGPTHDAAGAPDPVVQPQSRSRAGRGPNHPPAAASPAEGAEVDGVGRTRLPPPWNRAGPAFTRRRWRWRRCRARAGARPGDHASADHGGTRLGQHCEATARCSRARRRTGRRSADRASALPRAASRPALCSWRGSRSGDPRVLAARLGDHLAGPVHRATVGHEDLEGDVGLLAHPLEALTDRPLLVQRGDDDGDELPSPPAARSAERAADRAADDADVERQALVPEVPEVVLELLQGVPLVTRAAVVDLRPPGEARAPSRWRSR